MSVIASATVSAGGGRGGSQLCMAKARTLAAAAAAAPQLLLLSLLLRLHSRRPRYPAVAAPPLHLHQPRTLRANTAAARAALNSAFSHGSSM